MLYGTYKINVALKTEKIKKTLFLLYTLKMDTCEKYDEKKKITVRMKSITFFSLFL